MGPAATQPRRLGFRIVALLLGSALGLLLSEVVARVLDLPGEAERRVKAFDPVYAHVRADSWIFDFAIDERRHRAVDLRGQYVELPKPARTTRLLFLGDSATEGAFVELEEAFPHVFGELLDQRDPDNRVEVVNAGVWGMTTIDEYYLLEDKLLPLRPDAVVLGVFLANDINFNLGHPQRELRYRGPRLIDRLRRHSALIDLLFRQAVVWNERFHLVSADQLGRGFVPVELTLQDEHGLHLLSYPAGELALYMRRQSLLVDAAWSLFRDVLWRLRELSRTHGFELRVLLIPSPSSVTGRLNILRHPNLLQELRARGVDIERGQLDFSLPLRRALEVCRGLALTCVDPSPHMKPLGLGAFLPGDEHPSRAGHRALAAALLESR